MHKLIQNIDIIASFYLAFFYCFYILSLSRQNTSSDFGGSIFSFFKGIAGQKAITKDAILPVLDKMREHLCCE